MYTGSSPSLSLSDSNDCPFFLPPPQSSHSLKNTMTPLEFIRPRMHWENNNILLWGGGHKILHIVVFWLEIILKRTHKNGLMNCSSVLSCIFLDKAYFLFTFFIT